MPPTVKRTNSIRDSPGLESTRVNKRVKKTTSFQVEEEEQSDDDNDGDRVPDMEDSQDITIGNSEEEEHMEDGDSHVNDILKKGPRRNIESLGDVDFNKMEINEAGTISRVECVNFMCHKFLQIDLGPKINFIIGHNGSGKSAILTAITVALGANASATNRGKSVSSFIKEGTSAAIVTIHLTNNGSNAYRPDIYPERIIVERRINKEGGSPYKIKNKSGRVISTKKEDLVAILDHLNLLVNNPLTMLTQDMARKFLSDSSAEDKYKLFMHGTQLTQLQNDFTVIRESLSTASSTVKRKQEGLSSLQVKAAEAQRKYEDMQAAKEVESKIDELNNELVWSQIIRKEKERDANEKQMNDLQQELDNIREAQDHYKQQVHTADTHILAINEEWEKFRNELNPDEDEKNQLIQQKAELEVQIKTYTTDLHEINSQIKVTKTARQSHQNRLDEETEKLAASSRLKRNEITDEIKKLETTMAEEVVKAKDFDNKAQELQSEIAKLEEGKRNLEREISRHRHQREEANKLKRDMENQRGDRMRAYGHRMPLVLEAISKETRWEKRKPVGPFGATLELLKPEFATVLEGVLNNSLNAFVVETFKDRELLVKILANFQIRNISVFVSDYDIFDYSSGEPDPQYLTVLRALKFNDEWVKRQLITTNKIERMLLMHDRQEADDLMYRGPPRNIDLCFTKEGYKVGGQRGMKTESVDPYRGAPRFQKDIDRAISLEHNRAQEALKLENEKQEEYSRLIRECKDLEQQKKECYRCLQVVKREIAGLESTISQKKEALKEEDPIDLNVFHDDIKECDEKIKRYAGQFTVITNSLTLAKEQQAEIKRKMHAILTREANRRSESDEFRSKVNKIEQRKSAVVARLEELNVKAQTIKIRLEKSKNLWLESSRMVESWIIQSAEDYPDRIETNRLPDAIEKEIKHYEGVAQETEERHGMTLIQAQEKVFNALKEYDEAKKTISGLLKVQKCIRKMLNDRQEKWEAFRQYISLAAKSYFGYYLHLRGDDGSLRFNHELKRLEIRVATGDQYSKGSRQKDSRSLSGGEKSFSQISLLLSLWQSISSPLICLDEFDVFMDAVNRKQTMSMIMNAACDNTSQYILITPQDASNMEPGPYITVHRMADPDRAS
ncbi:P-loop containing nucleoside triphosphate hydrolase protein [Mucor ambiguus]|uniref:p-loop containing nucleoside triphosphate hydrolase protein n=1 Tax=Mucor ambiguus TaxID=91626 RepID=A0A0C9M891_9FUNG|nr:P-loop containing nucleoside triphosphate hydrolase protein [Mucor ambiguus]